MGRVEAAAGLLTVQNATMGKESQKIKRFRQRWLSNLLDKVREYLFLTTFKKDGEIVSVF
jgi:hypothetical protein